MAIKTGDKIPSVTIKQLTANGMQDLDTASVFAGRMHCSRCRRLYPHLLGQASAGLCSASAAVQSAGISVACLAVNDPFVMKAWAEQGKAEGITMLADGNAAVHKSSRS